MKSFLSSNVSPNYWGIPVVASANVYSTRTQFPPPPPSKQKRKNLRTTENGGVFLITREESHYKFQKEPMHQLLSQGPDRLTGRGERTAREKAKLILFVSLAPGTARAIEMHFPPSFWRVTRSMVSELRACLRSIRNFSFLWSNKIKACFSECEMKPK